MSTACALLVDDAATWLQCQEFGSWSQFCSAFRLRFCNSPEDELNGLMRICQGLDEDVEDYLIRFQAKVAAYEATGNLLPKLMQMKWFIHGLDPSVKSKIISRHPRTFEDAASDALYFATYVHSDAERSTCMEIQPAHFHKNARHFPARQHRHTFWQEDRRGWPAFQAQAQEPRYFDQALLDALSKAVDNLARKYKIASSFAIPRQHHDQRHQPMRGIGRLDYAHYVQDNRQFHPGVRTQSDDVYVAPEPDPSDGYIGWRPEPYSGHGMIESAPDPSNEDRTDPEDGIQEDPVQVEEDDSGIEEAYSMLKKTDSVPCVPCAPIFLTATAEAKVDSCDAPAALEPVSHLKLD